MPDFDNSNIQELEQVEITDLDAQVDDFRDAVSTRLLRFTRSLPFINEAQGKFILMIYCMCIVALLFMIHPDLPTVTEQFARTPAHELQHPLAVYPFTIQNTSSAGTITWIRMSNGQVIAVQSGTNKIIWHHCKVQRWFASPENEHPVVMACK